MRISFKAVNGSEASKHVHTMVAFSSVLAVQSVWSKGWRLCVCLCPSVRSSVRLIISCYQNIFKNTSHFYQLRAQNSVLGDLIGFWWRSDNPFLAFHSSAHIAQCSAPLWILVVIVFQSSPDCSICYPGRPISLSVNDISSYCCCS